MKTLYFAEILIMGRWDDGVLVQILKLQQSSYQLVRFFSINFAWDLYCWSGLNITPPWASAVKWVQNHMESIKQEIPMSQAFTTAFPVLPSPRTTDLPLGNGDTKGLSYKLGCAIRLERIPKIKLNSLHVNLCRAILTLQPLHAPEWQDKL